MNSRWFAVRAILALVLIFGAVAEAQVIPSTALPGRERQQLGERPGPRAQPRDGTFQLPSTAAPAEAQGIRLRISRFVFDGATVYSNAELEQLAGTLIGREISLQEVYDLAQKITAKYGTDGYVLSRAIVPPQALSPKGATVRIRIIEGYIDKVEWPASVQNTRDLFSAYAAKIIADRPVNIRTIERYLLLAGDLPGFKLKSTLRPSKDNQAAATLVVEIDRKPIDAMARIDNWGTTSRGPYEYLAAVTGNNLLGYHESVTATYAGTFQTEQLQYGALAARVVFNSEGLAWFGNVSYGAGYPYLDSLQALEFNSRSFIAETGFSQNFIRSREHNLTVSAFVFVQDTSGRAIDTALTDDRLRGARVRVEWDRADPLMGVNQVMLTGSLGVEGFGSTDTGNPLASRQAGRVDFSKIDIIANRHQMLGQGFSLLLTVAAQLAGTSLLAPEQCGYGGRYMGRAFESSELIGDSCWAASAELRYALPSPVPWLIAPQAYSFIDRGMTYTRDPAPGTPASQQGTSAGLGLRFGLTQYVAMDLTAAKPLAGRDDDSWQYRFMMTARY